MINSKVYRLIDANLNRAKEGLRVTEDICRYVFDQQEFALAYKDVRHQLTKAMQSLPSVEVLQARDIENDVGTQSTTSEMDRKTISDVYYANAQRVKESLRVLEESTKLIRSDVAQEMKSIRYAFYAIEKNVILYMNESWIDV